MSVYFVLSGGGVWGANCYTFDIDNSLFHCLQLGNHNTKRFEELLEAPKVILTFGQILAVGQ